MKMQPVEFVRELVGRSARTGVVGVALLLLSAGTPALADSVSLTGTAGGSAGVSTDGASKGDGETAATGAARSGQAKTGDGEAATPPTTSIPVSFEVLPASAYPSDPMPGLPGGSLSLVLDRLQWPYMPKYPGTSGVRVGISGSSWVDTATRHVSSTLASEGDQTEYRMQGRFTLRITPVYNVDENYFVQSNVELIGDLDQSHPTNWTSVDDAWIRAGRWKTFDVTVGRMQGFEVYHFGMGLDLNTFERKGAMSYNKSPVDPYGVTDLWDRTNNDGAIALHTYVPKWLRLELLARLGLSNQGNDIGIRPVGVIDLGWMKLKGGYERRLQPSLFDKSNARTETQGYGGELQFVLPPWVEFGGGAARRLVDNFDQYNAPQGGSSTTTNTYGGFLNFRPIEDVMVGFGVHYTDWEDFNYDKYGRPETKNHTQTFGAVQYLLWKKLFIKYVLAYAKGHSYEKSDDYNDTGFYTKSLSHRLRLMMFF